MSSISAREARKPVSKRIRFEVFKRDGFCCAYCGATPPNVLLECDHIEPVSAGGKTEMDNLVTACQPCNRGKSDVPLSSVPQSMAERAAEVTEREAQIAGYQAVLKQKRLRIEADAQEVLEVFCRAYGREGIPQRDFVSIKNFIEKIGLDQCLFAAEKAALRFYSGYNRAFKYFCGICWNLIKGDE